MSIYSWMEEIQTILQGLEDVISNNVFGLGGTNVVIGPNFADNLGLKQLPCGIITISSGDLINKALSNSRLHIGAIFHGRLDNIIETALDAMELVMKDTSMVALNWLSGPVFFSINTEDIYEVFSYEEDNLPDLKPPYGSFRLDYKLNRGIYT